MCGRSSGEKLLQPEACTIMHLKKRTDVDVVPKVRESAGNDLPTSVVTVLPHFRDLRASKHAQRTKRSVANRFARKIEALTPAFDSINSTSTMRLSSPLSIPGTEWHDHECPRGAFLLSAPCLQKNKTNVQQLLLVVTTRRRYRRHADPRHLSTLRCVCRSECLHGRHAIAKKKSETSLLIDWPR